MAKDSRAKSPGDGICNPVPKKISLTGLILPVDKSVELTCIRSSGGGTHATRDAFFAIDLASSYEKPAAVVRAAADGKVFITKAENAEACVNPEGPNNAPITTEASLSCGNGWGNALSILHTDGYYSRYAQLESISVEDGQLVRQGDPVGIEGMTGNIDQRHLHFGVNHSDATTPAGIEKDIRENRGASVPFDFKVNLNGTEQWINSGALNCQPRKIGDISPALQPKLRGISP